MAIQQANPLTRQEMAGPSAVGPIVPVKSEYRGESIILTLPGMDTSNVEEVSMFRAGMSELKDRRFSEDDHLVEVSNVMVEISNAAEELTFGAAERKRPEKAVAEELDESKEVQHKLDTAVTAEDVQSVLEKLTDVSKDKLAQATNQLLEARQDPPKEGVEKFLAQFKEVEHQYAALLQAKETVTQQLALLAGKKSADSEYLNYCSQLNSEINTKIKQLVEVLGDQIRAGINVSSVAVKFVAEFESSQLGDFRQLYKDCVLDYSSLWDVYRKVIRKFSRKKFKKSCSFLEESLVADMESEGASISREKLMAILNDVYQLRILGQLHDESDVLYARLKKKYLLATQAQDELGEGIVELFDGAITQSGVEKKVERILERVGIRHLAGRINLITGIKGIVRLIPVGIFRSDSERMRTLETIQKTLDIAIEHENESDE